MKFPSYFLSIFSFSIVLSFGISSCKPVPQKSVFTQKLYKDSGLSKDDLQRVQFFIDRDIVIYRVLNSSDSRVEGGKITIRGGENVEEIVIKRGTKGALVYMPKDDRLGISFDATSDEKYLMFGPNPKNYNRYSLLATEWQNGIGTVTYGDAKWKTISGNAYAALLVDLSNYRKTEVNTQVPKGREVR